MHERQKPVHKPLPCKARTRKEGRDGDGTIHSSRCDERKDEEAKIRKDPMARVTDILKKVFGFKK